MIFRVVRLTLIAISALLLSVVLALSFSPSTEWILAKVDQWVDGLTISQAQGNLYSGISAEQVIWQQTGLKVQLDGLNIKLDWVCISQSQLCVETLSSEAFSLDLDTEQLLAYSSEQTEEAAPSSGVWLPPVPFVLKALNVAKAKLEIDGILISWQQLQGQAHWQGKLISVDYLALDQWQLVLPQSSSPASPASEDEPLLPFQVELPEIVLPYQIAVADLRLSQGQIEVAEQSLAFPLATAKADVGFSELFIKQLFIDSPWGQLQLSGEQAFKHNFASNLSGHWQMPLLEQSLSTQFSLNGDGKALELWLQSQGAVAAEVDGQLAWLKPNLPFDLRAELKQPLSLVAEQLSLEQLNILASGDLSAYQAQINSELAGAQALRLSGDVQGDLSRLSAFALSGELLDGKATSVNDIDSAEPDHGIGQFKLSGAASWQQQVQAQLNATFSDLQLSHWLDLGEQISLPDIDGQISASLNEQQWQVSQAAIQGRWLGLPLSAKASGEGNLAEQRNQATLEVQLAEQRLSATLEQQQQQISIDGQLDAEQLADLPWFDKGLAQAQVKVRGTLSQPLINWQLTAEQLDTPDFSLAQVNSSGSLELDSTFTGQLQLGLAQLQVAGERIEQVDLAYKSAQGKQSLSLSAEQAERSLHLSALGQGDTQNWSGVLDKADISAELGRWDLSQDIELSYQQGVVSVGEHCWSRDVSQICLLQPFTSSGDSALVLSMQQFNFAVLNSLMPEGTRLEGSASMDLDAQLQQWQPQTATLKLQLSPGSLVQQDEIETKELHYQSLLVDAQLADSMLNWNAVFVSKELGKLESKGSTAIDKNGEINGALNIDQLQLSPLLPFFPILDNIEGEITGQVLLSGAVTKPSLDGEIKLSEAYLSGPQLPLSIENLQTQLRFDNQQAELEGQFTSGGKIAQWQGQFAWPNNQLTGELDFNASLLPLVIDPYASFAVSPAVKIKIKPDLIDVSGDINVEEGSIKVKRLPDSAISESSDAIVIEEQTEAVGTQRTQLDIRVSLADKITLEALGLNTRLKGLLSLKQAANEPLLADGRIELVDGSFRAYGQNLLIEKGWIMFNGPIEQPYLDFQAIRNPDTISDNVTVGVKVIGLADAPQVTLYSEPSMSQNEMLSYLLRGRGLSDTEQDDNALSSMLLSAGIGRTEGIVGKVGSTLGLNDLSLSTAGSGSSTQVEVSAYVLPGVQVRYGMGVFDPVNELTVKYEILPKLFIEAFSGLNNALDVYYEFYLD
ncbi:autotransporter assembly complex protein TamB [Agarivorans gilvus]|uniref:DUF490 domain-containing protein n=1 Tax=Agarivorans gilvus TaxID=680279 RepID=A0ABQ1HXG4_9ALTE|nr:translocation/assembly module TamB domain-containing protein [Agarivorans gilvus]GGA92446.1 DUF490 domain-containing protein [Agarivorans gilvus]